LLLPSCFSPSRGPSSEEKPKKAPPKYQACTCNFNRCYGPPKKDCARIIRCSNVTADVYAEAVGNRTALLVLDAHRYCYDPSAGYLRGN
jgi:hypothetical protein